MTSRQPLHRLAMLIAVGLFATACGSADESTTNSVPSTDSPTTTVADDDVSESDSPSENADGTDDANASQTGDTSESDSGDQKEVDDQPEVGEIECSPEECGDPDDQLPERDDDPDPVDPPQEPTPFDPAPADREFCAAITQFDDELPDDEEAAVIAAQTGLASLLALAPDELADDLQTILSYVDRVAAGEVTLDSMQDDPASERAGERISDFIGERCEGDTPPTTDPVDEPIGGPTDPADDPELPNGLVIPVVPFDSSQSDTQQPVFGERSDDGTPAPAAPGFTPAAADSGFCTGLDIIESRPQPTDDFEELIVIEAYLVAIEPLVPDEIAEQYSTLMTWLTEVVDNGSFEGMTEPSSDPELSAALGTIDTFVDTNCLGL